MLEYSGFKDKKGIPICHNDLLKIFHFRSRSGRLIYMYQRALKVDEHYYLIPNEELGYSSTYHRYRLDKHLDFSGIEVISGGSFNHPVNKTFIHWSDRKLKRNILVFSPF